MNDTSDDNSSERIPYGHHLAIPTLWKGYQMRSRTEARWGVFFDSLGIKWEWEPEGFVLEHGFRFLPDFYLPVVDLWAEVKPTWFTPHEHWKVELLGKATSKGCLKLVGPPDFKSYRAIYPFLGLDSWGVDVPVSLDIYDGRNYQYYHEEQRLFGDSDQTEECHFSERYKQAVYASRAERFGE